MSDNSLQTTDSNVRPAAGQKVTPCLWYAGNALEAASFYTSLIPGSRIKHVHKARQQTPGIAEDAVMLVEFELAGLAYQALNGRPPSFGFSDAVSLSVLCEDQAEVDRLWGALTADGGREIQCGWLKDKFGFAWQIVPRRMIELLGDPDPERSKRAMQAMMTMVKLDIAALERAAAGR